MSKYVRLGLIAVIGVSCVLLFFWFGQSEQHIFESTTPCFFGSTPSSRWYFSASSAFSYIGSTAGLKRKSTA